VDLLNKNVLV
jgi:hypothetical protein